MTYFASQYIQTTDLKLVGRNGFWAGNWVVFDSQCAGSKTVEPEIFFISTNFSEMFVPGQRSTCPQHDDGGLLVNNGLGSHIPCFVRYLIANPNYKDV